MSTPTCFLHTHISPLQHPFDPLLLLQMALGFDIMLLTL